LLLEITFKSEFLALIYERLESSLVFRVWQYYFDIIYWRFERFELTHCWYFLPSLFI